MANQDVESIILVTQQVLGKYIKKPPLTEKLLRKPPFRFLMDVFNNFIKQTGKFEGLYLPEEQQFENISDREDKIRFLQKMIDVVKLTTKLELKVRTSKIVAGQEPELTNELLQAMASVAEKNLDWKSAVDQVVGAHSKPVKATKSKDPSSKNPSPAGKEEDPKKPKEKRISPQEQKLRKATEQTSRSSPTDKVSQKKAKSGAGGTDPKLSRQSSKQKTPSPVKQKSKVKKETSTENSSLPIAPAEEQIIKKAAPEAPLDHPPVEVTNKELSPAKITKEAVAEPAQIPDPAALAPPAEPESRKSSAQRRSSASSTKSRRSSGSQRQADPNGNESNQPEVHQEPTAPPIESSPPTETKNNNGNNETKREIPLSRDNSKDSNQRPRTSLRPPSARPASARPGAPRRRNVEIVLQPNDQVKMSGINVKLETFGDLDDDGENLVIIEDANSHDIIEGKGPEEAPLEGQVDAQGRLVQQILETQKELVHQNPEIEPPQSATTRQSSARQVNDLRDTIQSLTKAINPMGKLLDFVPEDVDAMQLELTMWRDTYTQASMELKKERSLTASATEPLKHQLQQIQASIAEYRELIDESRHRIQQNNARILKMLMEQ
ncbi:uncharacterized protein Dana_GF16162 [Drosophila ananassae]|uniref:TRAF3-interacting protein 1 n=1 Tax=Drosophila ananassae TaxID=7217 RepID=B3LZX7_DROAN|nr:TRAF3-interacting protein 1 [Drosophila ananassae]EDV44167.1 uncharacterized protein Dana_GF16162 [Drosophila ananassae]